MHYACGFVHQSTYERSFKRSLYRVVAARENGDCGEEGATPLWDTVLLGEAANGSSDL